MASASLSIPGTAIEKLKGRENYTTWKFAVRAYLEMADLWEHVDGSFPVITETDEAKKNALELKKKRGETKARAALIMLVEPENYSHITDADTAKKVWENLEKVFDDSGLLRRVGLLRELVTTSLKRCRSMKIFVNTVISLSQKLSNAGMTLDDEWIGTLLLAGLGDEYKPLIMAIEGSGIKVSADLIKTKLLQEVRGEESSGVSSAMYSDSRGAVKKKGNNFQPRCFRCGKPGHYAKNCSVKKSSVVNEKDKTMFSCYSTNHRRVPSVKVSDVLYVPELCTNLLSVSRMTKKNLTVTFQSDWCKVFESDGNLLASATEIDGVYKLNKSVATGLLGKSSETSKQELWHRRLGHIGHDNLVKLKNGFADGLSFENVQRKPCEICCKGKQSRLPFKHSNSITSAVLELVHTDLCGPMTVDSFSGSRYFLTFIDDFSRKVFVYFLKEKSETLAKFKEFKMLAEVQTGRKIKKIRSDNGTEYCNMEFSSYLKSFGIQHEKTVPYTPEQNGLAERMNRTLVEKARCMIFDANLSIDFWAEAVYTSCYIVNRSPCRGSIDKTPEEIWTGKRPNLSNLRVFGCKVMVHVPKQKRTKFDAKADECIMVGYDPDTKGYRVFYPKSKRIKCSRDVVFFEDQHYDNVNTNEVEEVNPENNGFDENSENDMSCDVSTDFYSCKNETSSNGDYSLSSDDEDTMVQGSVREDVRRSTRTPKPVVREDFVSYMTSVEVRDPLTVEEALTGPNASNWEKAMNDEYKSLMEMSTWMLVDLPMGRKPISNKWVFKTKRNSDGIIDRYKARLVAKGCAQRKGIDYEETFSPVVRYSSIRFLIAMAAKYDLDLDQMDVITAYLHGDLKDEIFMVQPETFGDGSSRVCRLNKSIYGLKQSGRVWYQKLDAVLKKYGLMESKIDSCIYYRIEGGNMLIVAVYVDDLLLLSNDVNMKNKLKSNLCKEFQMKDVGEAKYVLGMRISRNRGAGTISIDQSQYIKEILEKFNMFDCNPVSTPADVNQKLTMDMSPKNETEKNEMDRIPYQEVVGSVLYAAQVSRPDIQYTQ